MKKPIFLRYLADLYRERVLLSSMARLDFRDRYAGSALGSGWAFLHPVLLLLIFWFVFQVGFKSVPVDNVPFVLWLTSGLIPWFFFAESLAGATHSVLSRPYLVKKVVFPVHLLPLIRIQSAWYVHLAFLGLGYGLFLAYGYRPQWIHLQLVYYEACLLLLLMGCSWLTASLQVFLKDVGEIISVVIQVGFWLTPIFWNAGMVPEWVQWWLKWNPVYYIVQGFRDTLIDHHWWTESLQWSGYFWGVTILLLWIGASVFHRLRHHFSDCL